MGEQVVEYDMQQYRELSRIFKRMITEEINSGEYRHLRKHKTREKIDTRNFLNSRFKISMLARPPLVLGRGNKSQNLSNAPGKTDVLLYIHGTFVDPANIAQGYSLDDNRFRATVRDPIFPRFPFHVDLIGRLSGDDILRDYLLKGNYEEFVRDSLTIADSCIERFSA